MVRYLTERLGSHPGLVVEDKKYSVTIHYRNVRGKAHIREAIAEAIRNYPMRALSALISPSTSFCETEVGVVHR